MEPPLGISGRQATASQHDLINFIFGIANKLRGPYRPPQYRRVMLPMTVLRRLDCVLAPTKDQVLEQYKKLKAQKLPEKAIHAMLAKTAAKDRTQPLYSVSRFTFSKLLGDPDNIAFALELLDQFIDPSLKPRLFPLFDDSPIDAKMQQLQLLYPRERYTPIQLINYLLNRDINLTNRWIKACAIHATAFLDEEAEFDSLAFLELMASLDEETGIAEARS